MSLLLLSLLLGSCHTYDNFTTYFNAYYNMDRLMQESESDFEYYDEVKKNQPRVFVAENELYKPTVIEQGPPEFMKDLIISKQKLQPVKIKIDSIEIKGSKILAQHPKSDYIEGALYLMAKAYFYKNEWLNAQVKCGELIDKFPSGDLSPDAHLLMAQIFLIQKKFITGKTLLSRTVDIAWQKKRYDILSEAFRLEAEVALLDNDLEGALRPYRQAIAQSDDNNQKARWQVDMGALLYRMGKYERSREQFKKSRIFSPDYVTGFESRLYEAACLTRLGRTEESSEILDDLYDDGKYEEWRGHVYAEKMNLMRRTMPDSVFQNAERFADSAFVGNDAIAAVYFERGMELYEEDKYSESRKYFARSSSKRSPVFETSKRMYDLINEWEQKKNFTEPMIKLLSEGKQIEDSVSEKLSRSFFELGRIHSQLDNQDSIEYYYENAVKYSRDNDPSKPRYLYVYARLMEKKDPLLADSVMEIVASQYSLSEYGKDAMLRQGYTKSFIIDTTQELFFSGSRLRQNGDYDYATQQFTKLYTQYPRSEYAPRALYTLGWMFEKERYNVDSAAYYYSLILEKYPLSEFASDVRLSLEYYYAKKNGTIPDSLKDKELIEYKAKEIPLTIEPIKREKKNNDDDSNPLDLFTDPKKLLNKAKEAVLAPIESIKDLPNELDPEMLKDKVLPKLDSSNTNPLNFFKLQEPDSTKQEIVR